MGIPRLPFEESFACRGQYIIVAGLSRTILVEKITALIKYFSLHQCCYFLIWLDKGEQAVAVGGALVKSFLWSVQHTAILLCAAVPGFVLQGCSRGTLGPAFLLTATSQI